MQIYRLIPVGDNVVATYIATIYNRFMHYLAKESAINQCKYTGKSYYGCEMFGSICVFSSVEKDDINQKMPKGNKMNIAELLRHKIFHITTDYLRKKNT